MNKLGQFKARIAAMEQALRSLLDAATVGLDMMLVSAERRSLVIVIRKAREVLKP